MEWACNKVQLRMQAWIYEYGQGVGVAMDAGLDLWVGCEYGQGVGVTMDPSLDL